MAKGGIGGDLKIRLGLDFTGLQQGLLTAESTMKQGIAALNAQKVQIKVQSDIDMSKLSGVGSELDKLKVKETELTNLIRNREDLYKSLQRVAAANKTLGNVALSVKDENNLRRVEQELERLKAQLRNVNQQKVQIKIEADQAKINQAEQHLKNSIARMQTQIGNLKIRADLDASKITGADAAIQKEILSQKTLNAEIQKQELILQRLQTLQNVQAKNYGANALPTLNTQGNILQQQQNLARLREEVKRTTDEIKRLQEESAKAGKQTPLQVYQGLKSGAAEQIGKVTGAYHELQAATTSTDAAITASINLATRLGGVWGATAAAIAAVPVVTFALQKELVNMAMPAIKSGDAAYTLSRQMATTTSEASRFSTTCKLMGVDTQLVLGSLQRLDKQWQTAGASGNNVTKTLQAFGVSLTDTNGKLKSHEEQMLALAEGFQRARKSGQQFEMQNLLIRNGMGDMVVAIEDYAANLEVQQTRLVKAGLADAVLAHQMQGEVHLMNAQIGQLDSAFSAAMLPVAQDLTPRITEVYAELTRFINSNKDTIKLWGQIASDVLNDIGSTAGKVLGTVGELVNKFDSLRAGAVDTLVDKYAGDESVQSVEDIIAREEGAQSDLAKLLKTVVGKSPILGAKLSGYISDKTGEAVANQAMKGIEKKRKPPEKKEEKADKVKKFDDASDAAAKESANLAKETESILTSIAAKGRDERIKALQTEIADKLKLTQSDAERAGLVADTEAQITALLEEETAQRIAAIKKEAAEKKAAIPNAEAWQINTIDANAEAKIQQAQTEAAAKRKSIIDGIKNAEKQALDAQKQFNEQVATQIDGIWQSATANRIAAIDREKQAWIQKGLEEVKASKWAEEQKRRTAQTAAQEMFTSQRKYLELYRKAVQEGRGIGGATQDIAKLMRKEKGIKDNDFTSAEEIMGFQKAMMDAQNNLVPVLGDSVYQGVKRAMVEVWRGGEQTFELPQNYQSDLQNDLMTATNAIIGGVAGGAADLGANFSNGFSSLGEELTAASNALSSGISTGQKAQTEAIQNMVKVFRRSGDGEFESPLMNDGIDYQKATAEYMANQAMMLNKQVLIPDGKDGGTWLTREQLQNRYSNGSTAEMNRLKDFLQYDREGNAHLTDQYKQQSGIVNDEQASQQLGAILEALRIGNEKQAEMIAAIQTPNQRMEMLDIKRREYHDPYENYGRATRREEYAAPTQNVTLNLETYNYGSEEELSEKLAQRVVRGLDGVISGSY